MPTKYRVLLVESDDYSIDLLQRFIENEFPHVEVEPVSPVASIQALECSRYDIIVCDAYLRREERVNFVADLCREGGTIIIVITGDTEIKPDIFSPLLRKYIHHILYKPLDLKALAVSLRCALLRVQARERRRGRDSQSAGKSR